MRMNWASCKRQGASAYREGSYAEALEYFQGAIGLLIDESESVIVSKMDEAQVSYSFMNFFFFFFRSPSILLLHNN